MSTCSTIMVQGGDWGVRHVGGSDGECAQKPGGDKCNSIVHLDNERINVELQSAKHTNETTSCVVR